MTKQTAGRNLRRSTCPKVLWGDCIERKFYIISFTDHDIYIYIYRQGGELEIIVNDKIPDNK